MIDLLLRKMRYRDEVSAEQERTLLSAFDRSKQFSAGQTMVVAGDELSDSMCLLEGFAFRFKDLSDGQRQVLELNVPGDFIDLHGFVLKRLDHGIQALTHCKVGLISHADLRRISETDARLTRLLWFQTAMDAAIHRAWVTSLGRRSATQRLAHLFCELKVRLDVVGLGEGNDFDLPMSQADLSDLAGISAVHTNRSLQSLRKQDLATFSRGRVHIPDFERLAEMAEFDRGYLYLTGGNRR